MRTPARRYIILILGVLSILGVFSIFAAFAAHPQSGAKGDQSHEMTVTGVGDTRVISISLTIVNDTRSKLVMPSCGQLIDEYAVCLPPAFLEQYDGTAWQRAKDKGDHMYGELAAPPLAIIEPGASIRATVSFPFDSYRWQVDQPVRLVIPVWPASESRRTRETRILYATPPLQPPSAGVLAFQLK